MQRYSVLWPQPGCIVKTQGQKVNYALRGISLLLISAGKEITTTCCNFLMQSSRKKSKIVEKNLASFCRYLGGKMHFVKTVFLESQIRITGK